MGIGGLLHMRYQVLATVAAGMLALGACGGGNKDENAAATTTDSSATAPAAPANSAAAPGAPSTAAAAAVTGTTHEVKMVMDSKGYRFDPANLTVKVGDGIKFIAVSGNPHNVAFDPSGIPAGSKDQLQANMQSTAAELTSPMLMGANETFLVSFANLPAGKYALLCPVHLAMNMKGEITVQ
jgi:plastocyanin